MDAIANILPCGERLHLQHGPIDLIIGAHGDRDAAFAAAKDRFSTVLQELVCELPDLKLPMNRDVPAPSGHIARRMDKAVRPFIDTTFVTRMASVAGSVADTVLDAMKVASLSRAYVNNGGDIALHLTKGQSFTLAMADHAGIPLGRIAIDYDSQIRGIATSGRHGRSFSLGIADSVTVLASDAARADVAATLISNAVDLPDHHTVARRPASSVDDTSDLGDTQVVVGCGPLGEHDKANALTNGRSRAEEYTQRGLIAGAALFLQGQSVTTCPAKLTIDQRTLNYA